MQSLPPYKIFPLGDSALTIDFGNRIDPKINEDVISLFRFLSDNWMNGVIELVPSYSSLTVYYDFLKLKKNNDSDITVYDQMRNTIDDTIKNVVLQSVTQERVIKIPACYDAEFGIDIEKLAAQKNISPEEVVAIHTTRVYRIYMLGFLPGFAYMGQVNEQISMQRKPQPENIKAGSVGIAGQQTGIYPLDSPGGWQIIGRTPVKTFDNKKTIPALFQAGDNVQFYSITKDEFEDIKSRHT